MQSLQLSQKQTQKLSPLQLQYLKLLELNALEIEERIKEELIDNPALEEGVEEKDLDSIPDEENERLETLSGDELIRGDYSSIEEMPPLQLGGKSVSEENSSRFEEWGLSNGVTLLDHLEEEVALLNLTEREKKIAFYLIGNIDDDGYLRREISLIADDLSFAENENYSSEEVEKVLRQIQQLSPEGIGATSLQECLLIQIRQKEHTIARENAMRILEEGFEAFSKKNFDWIKEHLSLSSQALNDAFEEIVVLNPKPGKAFSATASLEKKDTILPDFSLEIEEDTSLTISLNYRQMPPLRVGKEYQNMALQPRTGEKKEQKIASDFAKEKIEKAEWFVSSIRNRFHTLFVVMQAIATFQHSFFLSGKESDLRPMTLKDISDCTHLDISTISRACNGKYVETPLGTYSLKFFFSEGVQKENGEEASQREVKLLLKQMIEEEDKTSPLSDERLSEMLKGKGFQVARRTVAKYREQLFIPVAKLRRNVR